MFFLFFEFFLFASIAILLGRGLFDVVWNDGGWLEDLWGDWGIVLILLVALGATASLAACFADEIIRRRAQRKKDLK
jgi:hypothetical protein